MTEIPGHVWHEMRGHTPWGPEWFMLRAQNNAWGEHAIPYERRMEHREGVEGCVINFHLIDERWHEDEARARKAEANQELIMNAPRLYAEVERLRGQLGQARECLWWCYDNERFGSDIDEQSWEFIGRLLGADTDHNDNEWKEDEE